MINLQYGAVPHAKALDSESGTDVLGAELMKSARRRMLIVTRRRESSRSRVQARRGRDPVAPGTVTGVAGPSGSARTLATVYGEGSRENSGPGRTAWSREVSFTVRLHRRRAERSACRTGPAGPQRHKPRRGFGACCGHVYTVGPAVHSGRPPNLRRYTWPA